MITKALQWPPPYTINKMQRARHVTIKITQQKGLEFVVPHRFNQQVIPKLLKVNKHWIQKQLGVVYQESRDIRQAPLPTKITLAAVRQTWTVRYKPAATAITILANQQQKVLMVTGRIKNKNECKKHLNLWVKSQAKKLLIPKLKRLGTQTGLKYKEAVIRNQSGRWASCSSRKRISLNYKLIYLSAALCKHILIHELCHLVHLDHSQRFWRLLARHDAYWERHHKAMQVSERLIPLWSRELGVKPGKGKRRN